MDRRDDRVGALGHRPGEALVGEVADVLGDSVERRGAAGAADDGAHLRRPLDERPAHGGAHQSVRTGHHDDGRGKRSCGADCQRPQDGARCGSSRLPTQEREGTPNAHARGRAGRPGRLRVRSLRLGRRRPRSADGGALRRPAPCPRRGRPSRVQQVSPRRAPRHAAGSVALTLGLHRRRRPGDRAHPAGPHHLHRPALRPAAARAGDLHARPAQPRPARRRRGQGLLPHRGGHVRADPLGHRSAFRVDVPRHRRGDGDRQVPSPGVDGPAEEVQLHVSVHQRPHPPLWYPTSNAASIPRLGDEGYNVLFGFGFASAAPGGRA